VFRSVLQDVAYYAALNARLAATRPDLGYEFCFPAEFARLARAALGSSNSGIATHLWDTLPGGMAPGETRTIEFAVRNDGWDTWLADGPDAVSLRLECGELSAARVPLPRSVAPGDAVVLSAPLTAPRHKEAVSVRYAMVRADGSPFGDCGLPGGSWGVAVA
jgi:hypothetical protein